MWNEMNMFVLFFVLFVIWLVGLIKSERTADRVIIFSDGGVGSFKWKNHSTWSNNFYSEWESEEEEEKNNRNEITVIIIMREIKPSEFMTEPTKCMNLSIYSRAEAYKCFTCWLIVLKCQTGINVLGVFEATRNLFFLFFFVCIGLSCCRYVCVHVNRRD